jgi:hypothetical protein
VLHVLNIKSNRADATCKVSIKLDAIVFKSVLLQCDHRTYLTSRAVIECTKAVILENCVGNVVLDVSLYNIKLLLLS